MTSSDHVDPKEYVISISESISSGSSGIVRPTQYMYLFVFCFKFQLCILYFCYEKSTTQIFNTNLIKLPNYNK